MLLARAKISEQKLQQPRADIEMLFAADICPLFGKHRAGNLDLL